MPGAGRFELSFQIGLITASRRVVVFFTDQRGEGSSDVVGAGVRSFRGDGSNALDESG